MKILQLKASSGRGGAETICRDATEEIARRGINILTVIGEKGWLIDEMKSKALNVLFEKANPFSIARICKNFSPDVILVHGARMNIAAVFAGKILGIPVVAIEHGVEEIRLKNILLKTIDKLAAIGNVKRIAVSTAVKDSFVKNNIIEESKIEIVHNGIKIKNRDRKFKDRTSLRNILKIRQDAFVVVSVGRLVEIKGHSYLIHAISELSKQRNICQCVIVGDGPKRRELENQAVSQCGDNVIVMTGAVDNVDEYLAAADAFVLPSLFEGLPIAMLEAMDSGLPIIATRVSGIPEVIVEGITGLLCDPKDALSLRNQLQRIIDNPGLGQILAANGQKYVKEKHSLEAMVTGYLNALESAINLFKKKKAKFYRM
jgi:glycosyltransferase involved in cell wall biosynthesis